MLERRTAENGVVYYVSPLLEDVGVPHAFSTRLGGISAGPFTSMNLGNPSGCSIQDESANIERNYSLLQEAIGVAERRRIFVHQVHGGEVLVVEDAEFDSNRKADALVTKQTDSVLSIRVADCVPILLTDRIGWIVSAVHAGWRGIVEQAIPNAIRQMQELDSTLRPADIVAAIGPCIGFKAFEVGGEVLVKFDNLFGHPAPIRYGANGKGYVDLRRAAWQQLIDAGVPTDHIDRTDRCTFCDVDEFFSHRRENGVTGRMAALIGAINGQ